MEDPVSRTIGEHAPFDSTIPPCGSAVILPDEPRCGPARSSGRLPAVVVDRRRSRCVAPPTLLPIERSARLRSRDPAASVRLVTGVDRGPVANRLPTDEGCRVSHKAI